MWGQHLLSISHASQLHEAAVRPGTRTSYSCKNFPYTASPMFDPTRPSQSFCTKASHPLRSAYNIALQSFPSISTSHDPLDGCYIPTAQPRNDEATVAIASQATNLVCCNNTSSLASTTLIPTESSHPLAGTHLLNLHRRVLLLYCSQVPWLRLSFRREPGTTIEVGSW